jgi:putative Mg2+ transporter-C (MgtC) family protein
MSALERQLLVELGMAVLLGGVIGLEREWKGRPAGLRTNILICMAAVLFAEVSQRAGGDPGRIAAQVLTGVGFLGAGTILQTRDGGVTGLTTAATIWMVTAIGLAIGFHHIRDAVAVTVVVMLVLAGLGPLETYIGRKRPHREDPGEGGSGRA